MQRRIGVGRGLLSNGRGQRNNGSGRKSRGDSYEGGLRSNRPASPGNVVLTRGLGIKDVGAEHLVLQTLLLLVPERPKKKNKTKASKRLFNNFTEKRLAKP